MLKFALTLLFGGGGAWIANMIRERVKARRQNRQDAAEKPARDDRAAIAITEQLQALASSAVADVQKQIDVIRAQNGRLSARVAQLERVLHDHSIDVPPED